jgi:hypothetical protein
VASAFSVYLIVGIVAVLVWGVINRPRIREDLRTREFPMLRLYVRVLAVALGWPVFAAVAWSRSGRS